MVAPGGELADCVKIAWDLMVPERMTAYMTTWQHVLACVTKLMALITWQPWVYCGSLLKSSERNFSKS